MTTANNMKCIGTSSFTQSHGSQLEEIRDGLTLFVALAPNQFNQLCSSEPVFPDPYSGRFGLRANELTAVQRGHEFMNWRQDGRDPGNEDHVHQKKFVVCTLKITPLGYFALMENGTLEKGQDLLDPELRKKITRLLELKAIASFGAAPICSSFSVAITPPIRNSQRPRGIRGLSLGIYSLSESILSWHLFSLGI